MADVQLTISADERQYLLELLQTALKDTEIEEHRTRNPSYRQHVLQHENVINSLLKKLG